MKQHIIPVGLLLIFIVALSVSITIASRSNVAPSYEEIRRTIHHITKHDIGPKLPEVSWDGLVDQEAGKEISSYQDTLEGKKLEGWQGWYAGYTEIEPNVSYNVGVYMEEPDPRVRRYADVLIVEVPGDQLQKLKSLQDGEGVVFSGTISGIMWSGRVHLYYSMIEPLE